jgi:predicted nucleic acid-binding protein
MLVDAGPLVAILDRDDRDHDACVSALRQIEPPLLTTWPALTEAIYLMGDRCGWSGQELLWRMVLRGELVMHELDDAALRRSHDLMQKYRDLPMDLADATLVATAEQRRMSRIFTLDSDFRVYRLQGRRPFQLVP